MPRGQGPSRRALANERATPYGGVLSRRLLRELGITHDQVRDEVAAERWRTHGHQTVAMHRGRLDDTAQRWRAVWEVGHRIAVLDGVSALQCAGLTGFTSTAIDVSIPHGCRPYAALGVVTHRVSRLTDGFDGDGSEVVPLGVPRTRNEVAALRAAHWALSDRQAALILCLVVQQRLTTPHRLREMEGRLGIRGRKAFVGGMLGDLEGGVHSLGELDFARMCRARGLPEPSRQVVVTGPTGRMYLDVRWDDIGLVVEIDGAQHRMGLAVTDDNLARNAVVVRGGTLLRFDTIGLRLRRRAYIDQVCEAHHRLSRQIGVSSQIAG